MTPQFKKSADTTSFYAELQQVGVSGKDVNASLSNQDVKELLDRSVRHKPSGWSWVEFAGTSALCVSGFVYGAPVAGTCLAGLAAKRGYDLWGNWSASKNSEKLEKELVRRNEPHGVQHVIAQALAPETDDLRLEGQSENVSFFQGPLSTGGFPLSGDELPLQSPVSPTNPVLIPGVGLARFLVGGDKAIPDGSQVDSLPSDGIELGNANKVDQKVDSKECVEPLLQQKEQLGDQNQMVKVLSSENAKLLEDMKAMEKLSDQREIDLDRLSGQINKLKAELDELKSGNVDQMADTVKSTEERDQKIRQISELMNELDTKSISLNAVQKRLHDTELELRELKQAAPSGDGRAQGAESDLDMLKEKSDNWDKLCLSLGAKPDIDLPNLVDNLKLQEESSKKWHATIDTLRGGGLDLSDEDFLGLVQKLVAAKLAGKQVPPSAQI